MQGKLAVFYEAGRPFELQEAPIPEVEPGAILIKVSLANICGSDLHYWRGDTRAGYMAPPPRGTVLGHEMVGRVHTFGKGVSTDSLGEPLSEGDRVVYCYFYPCGRCYACLGGDPAACPRKQDGFRTPDDPPYFSGAYAEYYYLKPGGYVFKVPNELSDEIVAPANCALSEVMYGLARAGLGLGDSVVIQGAGGLGLYACAVAREMGASTVICVDLLEARLELARAFGADHTINATEVESLEERVRRVQELTDGVGAHVVAELAGVPKLLPEGLEMLRNGGTFLEIGSMAMGHTVEVDPSVLIRGSKRIIGIATYEPRVLGQALGFLQRTLNKYPYDKMLSHIFPLEEINQAFEQAEWLRSQPTSIIRAALST